MRVLLLGNNRLAGKAAQWLRGRGETLAGVVLHPKERRSFGREIVAASGVDARRVFDGSKLERPETLAALRALKADIAVSVLFGYILRKPFLDLFPRGCVNLHPAYLPWNRGAYPNVWGIVDGTPAGATLHYIDEGVDTGDIVARRRVPVEPTDTGASLYAKLEKASLALFKTAWPRLRSGRAPRVRQAGRGTRHKVKDAEAIDLIRLDKTYTARRLIDILRARTFPPHKGAYFMHGTKKVYLRLQLLKEEELS